MLAAYIAVVFAYGFAASAAISLISGVNHLDSNEVPPAAEKPAAIELKRAS